MLKVKQPKYYMFIDESGESSLNHKGRYFILAAIIIDQQDFEFIQGYLRILKRKYFLDDFKVLHTTDLFERPYQKYRRLIKPRDNSNKFINRLQQILMTIPCHTCVYQVDKDQARTKYGYKPAKWRKSSVINVDLPYEVAATRAILDFEKFLTTRKATGEIVIESRLNKDRYFVEYFDNTRKPRFPGGIANPRHRHVMDSIPSLFISNKGAGNVGLELADVVAYVAYRRASGDSQQMMKLSMNHVNNLHSAIKISAHIGAPSRLIHRVVA
jgi:hypothetical protein